jgi:hypothetical protein
MNRILLVAVVAFSHFLVAAGQCHTSVAYVSGMQKNQSPAQVKADCVGLSKRGSTGVKDFEYLPTYWARSGPGAGYHCWTVDNYSPFGLHWSSAENTVMNDFLVYRYDVSTSRLLTLELKGGWISFSKQGGDGKSTLTLAAYDRDPESVFSSARPDFKKLKPLFEPKIWPRPKAGSNVKIYPASIPLQFRGGALWVVIAGLDSWSDASVRVDVVGLRLVSKMPPAKAVMKK